LAEQTRIISDSSQTIPEIWNKPGSITEGPAGCYFGS